jgi:trans-aconitate methyltransferase
MTASRRIESYKNSWPTIVLAPKSMMSRSLSALDGSPEMLQLNQARLRQASIEYQCADLFTWEADRQYDLVFFAFWLSHVPPTHLTTFLER